MTFVVCELQIRHRLAFKFAKLLRDHTEAANQVLHLSAEMLFILVLHLQN